MPTSNVTVADVGNLIGDDLTADTVRVEALIDRAERLVAAELPGFTFGATAGAVATLEPDGDDVLMLPNYPVTDVTAVTVAGAALDASAWQVNRLGELRRRHTARLDPLELGGLNHRWPDRGTVVEVTYDHGYAAGSTPDDVFDIIVELAAGRVVNPTQVAQEALGDRSVSFGGGGANADNLTRDQRRRLRQWRRTAYASLRVRS